uniref:ECF transporter S component n=1 Tax=Globicatella sulfidifaciens TaxID=136093 RepID=UPI0023F22AEF|nr:ECF transporter S component [Globicatella sulfidifaciens]
MEKTYSNSKTGDIVKLGLFFALVFIQTWVPFLGNINTPLLSVTIVHVTVIVATLWLGIKEGVLVGTFWGINSWLRALIMPNSLMAAMVFNSPIISVLPRFLMPLIIGAIYYNLSKNLQNSKMVHILLGALGSLLNTAIVLGFIGLFRANGAMQALGADTSAHLWKVLWGIVISNGVPEFLFSGIVTPPLLAAVKYSSRRK